MKELKDAIEWLIRELEGCLESAKAMMRRLEQKDLYYAVGEYKVLAMFLKQANTACRMVGNLLDKLIDP